MGSVKFCNTPPDDPLICDTVWKWREWLSRELHNILTED